MRIFGSTWVFQFLLNILNCDQTFQVVGVVHHQQFFNAVLVKNFFRALKRGAHGNGDQIFFGHHPADGNIKAALKTKISIGKNSDQLLVFCDWDTGNLVFAHDFQCVRNLVVRRHGDRVDDHAAFRPLHLIDLFCLLLHREIAMDDAEPTLLCQCNCHVRFSYRVHGGAQDGDVQANIAGDLRLSIRFRWNHIRARRKQ